MLSLQYQGNQRGPVYYFQIESTTNFLSEALVAVAYRANDLADNFTIVNEESFQNIKTSIGTFYSTCLENGHYFAAVSFCSRPDIQDQVILC
jgi:hypothetical protein